jgi:hypothetical protein
MEVERSLLAEMARANPLHDSAIGSSSFVVLVGHFVSLQVVAAGSCDVYVPGLLVNGSPREDGVEAAVEVMVVIGRKIGRTSKEVIKDLGVKEL